MSRPKNLAMYQDRLEKLTSSGEPEKGKTEYFTDTPKTKSSMRDIPLTDELKTLLDDQKRFWSFKVEKIDRISQRIREDGYQLEHITSHVFRHTFATRAIEAGMKPQVLKDIMGHTSLAMTMDLYSHVLPDTKAEEMEKIAGVF